MSASRTPLEKRIRRRIAGRDQRFFAATAPGFEGLCRDELTDLGIGADPRAVTGGVTFTARLHDAYRANLYLKTANRILMRIGRFRADGFPLLEKHLKAVEWELFLRDGPLPSIRVTTRRSRLYHTQGITERVLSSIEHRRRATPFMAPAEEMTTETQQVFVRIVGGQVELSIDSSGPHLHRRGIKTHGGAAPLRETIAAAVLRIAGHDPGLPLIDPMCGTGTFSLESAMAARRIPAGWFRSFAFQQWPGFAPRRWTHIRRTAREAFIPAHRSTAFASDIDPDACRRLQRTLSGHGFAGVVAVACRDFFQWSPPPALPPGLVVLNPPYGRRMGRRGAESAFISRVVTHLAGRYHGWQFALLSPLDDLSLPASFQVQRQRIRHGGLPLMLFSGRIG